MAENTEKTFDPSSIIAEELQLPLHGVQAVIELLNQSATVPFIARYRKERTGGLDEVQIRNIEERNTYHLELQARKETVLSSIEEQGKLTPELKKQILETTSKTILEDLYLPFKPKRKTRATIAKAKGLQPLADLILKQDLASSPETEAQRFVNPELEVLTADDALKGALDIVAEAVSETAAVREWMRNDMLETGVLNSKPTEKSKEERSKFEQYYEYSEPVKEIKSHRFLAIRRGEREGFLRAEIDVDKEREVPQITALMGINSASPYAPLLTKAVEDAYDRLLITSIESDVRVDLKQTSDKDAVDVFAQNLRDLLLAAPLGAKAVIGVDPGIRTGCKCVALDSTGKFLDNITIYPYNQDESKASAAFLAFVKKHAPIAIAVGNGTAGRETEAFVRKTIEPLDKDKRPYVIMVSESGASIYSASDLAREEFPDLDLTVRGAISIARRLQDPLSELVKIDPKSIGVGQYQHDVFQPMLKKKLDEVVESCVNLVGVELNVASAQLLQYVAGIGPSMAKKIVAYRDEKGKFTCRKDLLKVSGLGPKTFEQSAGFLRVKNSSHPLDESAVHPERYAAVENIARQLNVDLPSLIGNISLINKIDPQKYISDDLGLMTLNDIIAELKKPGRDPRAEFEPPKFDENIHDIKDLKPGMILDGVVTNVTNFGAFVDIGVHQDGLVHISQLNADHYITNPAEVVSVNMPLKVRVVEVDLERNRISLTCKLQESTSGQTKNADNAKNSDYSSNRSSNKKGDRRAPKKTADEPKFSNNPFASLKR